MHQFASETAVCILLTDKTAVCIRKPHITTTSTTTSRKREMHLRARNSNSNSLSNSNSNNDNIYTPVCTALRSCYHAAIIAIN